MFSRQLPLQTLIDLCRMLRHQIGAGIRVHKVWMQQSQRGPLRLRPLAARVSDALQKGSSLSAALEVEKHAFPPLFLPLVKLGESSGHMEEIFAQLEHYYQFELQLRRQFRTQTFLPIIQFIAATLIFAGLIFILGVLAGDRQKPLLDFFGLSGGAGALAFLGVVYGTLVLARVLFSILAQLTWQTGWMDRFLLSVPALGPCLNALAMSRLTVALQLTLDTGLPIAKALRLSLEATGNAYFASRGDVIVQALKDGETLYDALCQSGLFEPDFLSVIASSEESGRVPEMMRHQAQYYQEEATRKMKTLTTLAGVGVWMATAGFIIWAILRIAMIYINAIGGGL